MQNNLLKVVVVDPARSGCTAILQSALRGDHDIEIVGTQRTDVEGILTMGPDMIVLPLADPVLSATEDGSIEATQPCATIRLAWDLIATGASPVHIMVPRDKIIAGTVTAVDVIAMGISGVAGTWEFGAELAEEPNIAQYLRLQPAFWRMRRLWLYGQPAAQLFNFYSEKTSAWPTTIETNDGGESPLSDAEVRYCFMTALALAMLSPNDMTLADTSTSGMDKYAEQLQLHEGRTGLAYSTKSIARALRYLDRGWASHIVNHNVKRRNEMPIWARQDGFPPHLPLIRNVEVRQTSLRLYEGLEAISFERDWDPGNSPLRTTIALNWTDDRE